MTREQKIERARELRGQGWTYERIGREVGVSDTTAQNWLKPEAAREYRRRSNNKPGRNEQKRRIAATSGTATCGECGEPMGMNSKWRGYTRCRSCFQAEYDAQQQRVIDLDAQGLEPRQIAAVLGKSRASVADQLCRLRKKGLVRPRGPGQYDRKAA